MMRKVVRLSLFTFFLFSLVSCASKNTVPSFCRVDGVLPEASLHYLWFAAEDKNGGSSVEETAVPEKRKTMADLQHVADLQGQPGDLFSDTCVFFVSAKREEENTPVVNFGVAAYYFKQVDLNGDPWPDIMFFYAEGGFYSVMLFVGCPDNYYVQVGDFISRDWPVVEGHISTGASHWAVYEVVAPDPPSVDMQHGVDPLKNWSRRRWAFDPQKGAYRETYVERLE